MRAAVVLAASIACLVSAGSRASADDARQPLATTTPTRGDADARARATEHQRAGTIHYNLGDYAAAIAEFRAGYALTTAPGFLFNIAQAQRLSGDCVAAERSYRAYLRTDPAIADRPRIEARIAEAASCAAQRRPVVEPQRAPSRVAAPGGQLPAVESSRPRRPLRAVGWTAIGTGVVLGATSVWAALNARSAARQVEALSTSHGAWTDHFRDVEARGHRMEILSITSAAIGAVALTTGAYLVWRDARSRRAELTVARSRDGGRVGVAWRF